jgi:hypothetical protein
MDEIIYWRQYLLNDDSSGKNLIARQTRTGRSLGSDSFVKKLESICGKLLAPKLAGRKLCKED